MAISNYLLALEIQIIHLPIIAITVNSYLKILCWFSVLSALVTVFIWGI